MLLIANSVHAIPAKKIWRTVTQSDGSQLKVLLVGDEHLHYFLTEDNVPLVQRNRNFYYAQKQDGRLVSSSMLAHAAKWRTSTEKKQMSTVDEIETIRDTIPTVRRMLRKLPPARKEAYQGDKKGLIILVNFSDNKFSMKDPKATFSDIANKPGYSDNNAKGSVHDYFYDQSNGKFNLTFDVVGPIALKKTIAYYGSDTDQGNDARVSEMIVEACQAVKDMVDYNDYDWDEDGVVDQVFILYAGYGQATSLYSETVWPHESNISSKNLVLDGVRINTYACSNELYEHRSGLGIGRKRDVLMGIGVICHEFSHCLGLPDFYDTGGSNYGTGSWDILARGSYNGPLGIGWVPAGYTSYEKNFAGWLDYTELSNEEKNVTNMKPLGEGGEAYAIYNPWNRNEYFLLENRGNSKWDTHVPQSGLLVLHVDYDEGLWRNNMVNNTAYRQINNHQRLTVVPADNNTGNEDRDTYPLRTRDSLTAASTPALALYNTAADGSRLLGCKVLGIAKDVSGYISFSYKPDPRFANTTAIDNLSADRPAGKIVAIYDLRGIKLSQISTETLRPGIYVVKMADGSRRKLRIGPNR